MCINLYTCREKYKPSVLFHKESVIFILGNIEGPPSVLGPTLRTASEFKPEFII